MATTFASALVALLLPLLARELIEEAFPSGDTAWVARLLGGMLGIVAASLALSALRRYMMEKLCLNVMDDQRRSLFNTVLSLSPQVVQKAEGGEFLVSFTSDITMLRDCLRALLTTVVPLSVFALIYIAAMVWHSWLLSLALAVIVGPVVLVTHVFGRRIHRAAHLAQRSHLGLMADLAEALAGFTEIKLFGMEPRIKAKYAVHRAENMAAQLMRERVMTLHPLAVSLCVATGVCAIAWLSVVLLARDLITMGALTGFVVCLGLAYPPIQELGNALGQTFQLSAGYERIDALRTLPGEVERGEDETPLAAPAILSRGRADVTFDSVSYAYGGRFALRDITLGVQQGEHLAVVGASGAGKSTLLELVPRFLTPTSGRVLIGGCDIASMGLAGLRARIGLVTQQPYLFRGSVLDNLRAAAHAAPLHDVLAAARLARVDEFAEGMPQGYDSVIDSGGNNLSVGQRQRIAIARVLLRNPDILLLDEPTSALDATSERGVADAIAIAAADRTTITVAHRLSTVVNADRVVVLEAGHIAEMGTHTELLARNGAFARLSRHSTAAR